MIQVTPLLKKVLILWGGLVSGLVCHLTLYAYGGVVSGGDHPVVVLLLLPLVVWFGITFYTMLLDALSEFR